MAICQNKSVALASQLEVETPTLPTKTTIGVCPFFLGISCQFIFSWVILLIYVKGEEADRII